MIKSVKVLLNDTNSIIRRLGIDKNGKATEHFRDLCDKYMDSYIPMESGALKNNKSYPSNHEIQYNSPYAHYMYKGQLMVAPSGSAWARKGEKKHYVGKALTYRGGKRGANWDKRMYNDKKYQLASDMTKFMAR